MLIVSHFKTLSFFQWKQLLTRFGVIGISMKSIDLQRKGLAKGSVNLRLAEKSHQLRIVECYLFRAVFTFICISHLLSQTH